MISAPASGSTRAVKLRAFPANYGCNRLVYWESFDEVVKAINREKQLTGWRRSKKIAFIEFMNPRLGRSCGKMGRGDGVRRTVDCESVRTPCVFANSADCTGVLRLRVIHRFALDHSPLRMTKMRR